jgi:arginyl-tRNA synthetase
LFDRKKGHRIRDTFGLWSWVFGLKPSGTAGRVGNDPLIHEYPEEVTQAADSLQPHRIAFYLLELAKTFQAYYTKAKEDARYRVISGQVDTSKAKLYLCRALKLTFSQGLTLLGSPRPR